MTTSAPAPRISVVIPVRNGARDIDRQLDALVKQDLEEPFEVIVADNGSTDNTVAVATSWSDRLPYLRIVDARGPSAAAHARNEGALRARGELLLFCDADDRVHPEWAREISRRLTEFDLVGGRCFVVSVGSESDGIANELGLGTIHGYLPYALSGNCGVWRSRMLDIGGFDLSYDSGHEEVDFSWRFQEAGGSLGYAPGAVVDYRQRTTLRSLFRQRRRYAASSILLWTRFADHANLSPVSFSGSLRHCLRASIQAHRLFTSKTRLEHVAVSGWVCGLVEGHLRYRILGKPPTRQLMAGATSAR